MLKYKEIKTGLYPNINGSMNYQKYIYIPQIMRNSYTDYEKQISIQLTQFIYSFGKLKKIIFYMQIYTDVVKYTLK